jgi:hypothetical protein
MATGIFLVDSYKAMHDRKCGPVKQAQHNWNASYFWWRCLPWLVSGRLLLRWDICSITSITVTPFLKSYFISGLYSGIFALHFQIYALGEADGRKQNIIFHALWVLYVLSAIVIASDSAIFVFIVFVSDNERLLFLTWCWSVLQNDDNTMTYYLTIANIIVFACCDFIAQSIIVRTIIHSIYSSNFSKIHRCWIIWGRNIRVVIIPSMLAFAYLGP